MKRRLVIAAFAFAGGLHATDDGTGLRRLSGRTHYFNGTERRLTDVHGHVIKDILA